jgi:hypothetical protein
MRRRFLSLLIVGVAASTPTIGSTESRTAEATVTATVAVPSVPLASPWLRDEAAMMLVGSALIGLAAAIRRTV